MRKAFYSFAKLSAIERTFLIVSATACGRSARREKLERGYSPTRESAWRRKTEIIDLFGDFAQDRVRLLKAVGFMSSSTYKPKFERYYAF